jgi:hypothetical protein
MIVWDQALPSVQQGKGLFDLDADYVTIQGLQAHHMSWVFRAVGGVGDREGIVIERSHFEQITRTLETKNGTDAGGLKYSYFRHITARRHSKALFKIQQTSHYVWLIDIDGDSQFQDGDNFSAGLQFDEDAHHSNGVVDLRRDGDLDASAQRIIFLDFQRTDLDAVVVHERSDLAVGQIEHFAGGLHSDVERARHHAGVQLNILCARGF